MVATQGTLHRRLYELPELQEHREDHDLPLEQQYAPPTKSSFRKEGCFRN